MKHPIDSTITLLLLLSLAPRVQGDELLLTNGTRKVGMVRHTGEGYILESDAGWVRYDASVVREWIRKKTPSEVFQDRWDELQPRDMRGLAALASYCEANGLTRQGDRVHREILDIDPDNLASRRRFGHTRFDGDWADRETILRKLGMVETEGGWASVDVKRELESRGARLRSRTRQVRSLSSANAGLLRQGSRMRLEGERERARRDERLRDARGRLRRLRSDLERERERSQRRPLVQYLPAFHRLPLAMAHQPAPQGPLITPNPRSRRTRPRSRR